MQRVSLLLFFICCIGNISLAQNQVFTANTYNASQEDKALSRQFKDWKVFQMNTDELEAFVRAEEGDTEFQLSFGDTYSWSLDLLTSDIYGSNYLLHSSEQTYPSERPVAMQGYLAGGNNERVALTVSEDFIYGYVTQGNETYYIEPLRYLSASESPELFIIYKASDVIDDGSRTCAVDEAHNHKHDLEHDHSQEGKTGAAEAQAKMMTCHLVELAIASDFSMFQKYGSVAGVEAHNVGVMNNVATDYDDAFNDEIQFVIVEQFVATSAAGDPFTTNTDPGVLLPDFRTWGNAGGFVNQFDLGQHWSDRDFDGSTIGLAYVGVVCTGSRYHVLQDFTNNAAFKRVLTSHEMGHNFDQGHDASGSPFIMAPAVSAATDWSPASIAGVDGYVPGLSCLSSCLPVSTSFSADNTNICPGNIVRFFDNSTNAPSSWSWSFPGGTPASSTEQSPVVVYNTEGTYNVTLTASNGIGGDSFTQNGFVTVSTNGSGFFFYEDFESGATGWGVDNPDNAETWQLVTVEGLQSGTTAARVENYNYNAAGQRDALVSPTIDFTGKTDPELQIEYAYTNYDGSFNDSLIVQISTDDGASFYRVFAEGENGGGTLATRPTTTSPFNPSDASDWCFAGSYGSGCLNIPLENVNSSTVRIRIENYCGYGNNMYVANVGVFSTCQPAVAPTAIFSASQTQGCAPFEVQYSDNSQGSPSEYSWSFPGGTPSTSNVANPVVIYNTPGTYNATLTVSNAAGTDSQTQNNIITINEVSTPIFSFNATSLTVDFTDESVNADSYSWDFGDSGSSTSQNPQHTYTTEGTYTVILTTTNECGSNTTSQEVTVEAQPVAAFTAESTEGCAPFTVTYTNNSTGLNGVPAWEFPGGNPATSSDPNPTVTYDNPGSYSATLTVSNSAGSDSQTQSDIVTVSEESVPNFNFSASVLTVDFTNTSANADSYSWDFGDSNGSTQESPSHTFAQEGVYTVTLTTTNICGTQTATQTVTVEAQPVAAFTAESTEGCAPFTVTYTNNSTGLNGVPAWEFPGGNPATSSDANPTVVYASAGSYSATLTVSNSTGSDAQTQSDIITVNDIPSAAFSFNPDELSVTFSNSSDNADSYSWDFGDTNSSTETNPTHVYANEGTYTVVLTSTNECGSNSTEIEVEVSVTPTAPSAAFTGDIIEGCEPLTVEFTNLSSANAETYNWTFEGGTPSTSTETNPVVVFNNPGVYSISLTAGNEVGNSTSTQTDYITVNPLPSAAFSANTNDLNVDFTNNSTAGNSYSWDFGDTNGSTQESPSHTYAEDGTYTVILTVTNDCGTISETMEVTVATAPTAAFTADVTTGCEPLTVQFTGQASANTDTYNWSFPGGTPATSTDANPTVVYNAPGSFDVSLTVGNEVGTDLAQQSSYVVVDPLPTAAFTPVANELTVTFNNESQDGVNYTWDFGDAGVSSETNPSHTYANEGTYMVTLIVSNDCGTEQITQEVTVSLTPVAPTAAFSFSESEGCAPLTVQFTSQSSANTESYSWEFTGGTPAVSSDPNPTVVYNGAGTFSAVLTVSNEVGSDISTQSDIITVNDVPSADFNFITDILAVDFTSTADNADTYAWDFGDMNTSDEANPSHAYGAEGTYLVTLSVTNECGTTEMSTEVTVSLAPTAPTAGFSVDASEGCAPLTISLTNLSSANAETYLWEVSGPLTETSEDANPVFVLTQAGTYSVSLTASNEIGSDTQTQTDFVVVNDVPTASFSSSVSDNTVSFFDNSIGADTYSWDFGDTNTSTDPSPTHTYANEGSYVVTLTVSNECGEAEWMQVVMVGAMMPEGAFFAEVEEGCVPFTVQFVDDSSNDPTEWSWTFAGGTPETSTEQNPVVVFEERGLFDVTLVVGNEVGSAHLTRSEYIHALDVPEPEFELSSEGLVVSTMNSSAMPGEIYQWDFGDGFVSTAATPVHAYMTGGTYTVTLSVTNDCGTASVEQEITVTATAVNEITFLDEFNIFPNPNQGVFSLSLLSNGTGTHDLNLQLVNVVGQVIEQETVQFSGSLTREFNQSNLPAGMYFVILQAGDRVSYRKVLIE